MDGGALRVGAVYASDMGITFTFMWNMIGALVLIPALTHFLLPTSPFTWLKRRHDREALQ